jgi:hypothetical protein
LRGLGSPGWRMYPISTIRKAPGELALRGFLFSRMCVCIIRTATRLPAQPDTGAVQPRLDRAARPQPSPAMFGFARGAAVSALGILWPIQRVSVAHQPFSQISTADRAGRHRSPVMIQRDRRAAHRPSGELKGRLTGHRRTAGVRYPFLSKPVLNPFGGRGVSVSFVALQRWQGAPAPTQSQACSPSHGPCEEQEHPNVGPR